MAFGAAVEILAESVRGALDVVCIFVAGVDMVTVGLDTVGSCWCFLMLVLVVTLLLMLSL